MSLVVKPSRINSQQFTSGGDGGHAELIDTIGLTGPLNVVIDAFSNVAFTIQVRVNEYDTAGQAAGAATRASEWLILPSALGGDFSVRHCFVHALRSRYMRIVRFVVELSPSEPIEAVTIRSLAVWNTPLADFADSLGHRALADGKYDTRPPVGFRP